LTLARFVILVESWFLIGPVIRHYLSLSCIVKYNTASYYCLRANENRPVKEKQGPNNVLIC